jgi:hypothetical protein
MSTPTMPPALDALKRPGWLTFAGVLMISIGCLRIISAISYFADSAKVNDLSHGLFGDQIWLWGLWDLVIAVLAIWGGFSLLGGNTFGRVIGYIWAGVVLVQSFLVLAWAPWYGFAAMLLAIFVMYAISVTSGWREEPERY